ncbi:hypothetical protein LOZ53_006572 [Ophidiomyces ophidiicola]|nr:hypothetical protein LOZ55_003911 [Ophidiomyces ophidiicola]KAI1980911.1 hypothetical protein LOZ53_006572 [Ophidiomyces ophidiicola]KAI1984048.1 hypothetical protein LOZ51_006733 [Ophidiomyces ophidiicola]
MKLSLALLLATLVATATAKVVGSTENFPRFPDDPMIYTGPRRKCIGPFAPPSGECGEGVNGSVIFKKDG